MRMFQDSGSSNAGVGDAVRRWFGRRRPRRLKPAIRDAAGDAGRDAMRPAAVLGRPSPGPWACGLTGTGPITMPTSGCQAVSARQASSNTSVYGPPAEVYRIWYTSRMSKTVPIRELRSELSQVIDQVADLREHVIVTRHGRPAAVLVPVDEYEALEETAEILSDTETMAAIDEGRREVERGETLTLDEVRRELQSRRRG